MKEQPVAAMDFEVKTFKENSKELVDVICNLEEAIFEQPYPRQKIEKRCQSNHDLIGLVAYTANHPIAYKVGYELTARIFYSWIGGVVPEHRGKGVARLLMQQMHDLVASVGYKVIRTHTQNKYRDMLILNIRSGFNVVGTITEMKSSEPTIVLDKDLE